MHNRVELEVLVEELIAQKTTTEWEAFLQQADVPASAILTVPAAVEHKHTAARAMFPTLSHQAYGAFRAPGPPLRLGGEAIDNPTAPPLLGKNSAEVLRDLLGISPEAIAALINPHDGANLRVLLLAFTGRVQFTLAMPCSGFGFRPFLARLFPYQVRR